MKFGPDHKVIIDTLKPNEARAFVKFLDSEILRHWIDIAQAIKLKDNVREKFNIK